MSGLNLTTGNWVAVMAQNGRFPCGIARVIERREGSVLLRDSRGEVFEESPDALRETRAAVPPLDVECEASSLLSSLQELLGSCLQPTGDSACRRERALELVRQARDAIRDLRPNDIRQMPVGEFAGWHVRVTPEASQDGMNVEVDVPGQNEWFVPFWEPRDLHVEGDDVEVGAIHLGDAPAWVRTWRGPLSVSLIKHVGVDDVGSDS